MNFLISSDYIKMIFQLKNSLCEILPNTASEGEESSGLGIRRQHSLSREPTEYHASLPVKQGYTSFVWLNGESQPLSLSLCLHSS